jgi:hypothetical protein
MLETRTIVTQREIERFMKAHGVKELGDADALGTEL